MAKANLRPAAVAGFFYPLSAASLKSQIAGFLPDRAQQRQEIIACLLPHAGYVYSGSVAVKTLARVIVKKRVLLIGPNHTGAGKDLSIVTKGAWETPLGKSDIDSDLAAKLLAGCPALKEDESAHAREHSLEVVLPLLQYFNPAVKIVPIAVMSSEVTVLKDTGRQIGTIISESGMQKDTLIVASSDMTHYEPEATAKTKDKQAIDAICQLNEDKLAERVASLGITMCGWAAAIIMLSAAKALGATKATLTAYQTSADVTGDSDSVVGYAGITVG